MPLCLKKHHPYVRIGIWEITETPDELYKKARLSGAEQAFYALLKTDTRKTHWLSYRLLLPELMPAKDVTSISYDAYGKPHLDNGARHISVAHSGKFATLIVSDKYPVGIDIEKIRDKIIALSHKFLTKKEQEYHFPTAAVESLYTIWCAKEALYKLHGKRGLQFSSHIGIDPFVYTGSGTVTGHICTGKTKKTIELFYETIEDYMLVYAADTGRQYSEPDHR